MTDQNFTIALRAGLIGLGLLTLTACQTTQPMYASRAGDPNPPAPIPTPQTQAPVQSEPSAPTYNPRPADSGAIESQPLPPPGQAYNPPAPSYNPPAAYRPPAPQMETRTVAAGPVVEADGPAESYTVKPGDTLYSISRRMDLTVKQLADANGLKEPYNIRPGQKLKGKPSRGKAYVVQSGDTLSAIGRRFNVSALQIAEANDSSVGAAIRPGQRLILPQGYRDRGAQQVTVAAAPRNNAPPAYTPPPPPPVEREYARPSATPPAPPARPAPPPPANRPAAPVIIPSAPPATASDIQTAGRGRFIWPISGRQLGGFGSRGGAQTSNGLNIAANSGAPVKAAARGEVIYAGSELQGYGNLVLVRHDDGFVTVYAHLSRIGVKMQDRVTQGQEVGQVGQSGGVSEPQLYFEMRHQPTPRDMAKPFDPLLVLPAGR